MTGQSGLLTGGYHQVWPRDLYQMASAFLAANDTHSALACLNWLRRVQLSPSDGEWQFGFRHRSRDGSFYQNYNVDGTPYWSGLQMDEVAMPAILAYRLWQAGVIQPADYWDMVYRAADMIADFGPWTAEERWEETFGASPSTIAAEITALWTSAEFADKMGDSARAARYRATAQQWSDEARRQHRHLALHDERQTSSAGATTSRVVGAGNYNEIWNPNSALTFTLANGGGQLQEKRRRRRGFLELVRFGVRGALDQVVTDSVNTVDHTIRVDIPGIGPSFHRYTGDRYNYDEATGDQTDGMLWALLTGERGHYELARALASRASSSQVDAAVAPYVVHDGKAFDGAALLARAGLGIGARRGPDHRLRHAARLVARRVRQAAALAPVIRRCSTTCPSSSWLR